MQNAGMQSLRLYVTGQNLLTFDGGIQAIATVVAHEIGHNLGLDHLVESENLMEASVGGGQRISEAQIATASKLSLGLSLRLDLALSVAFIAATPVSVRTPDTAGRAGPRARRPPDRIGAAACLSRHSG